MTLRKDDGGTAFPHAGQEDLQPGMSLRDWFAGKAMAGLLMADLKVAGEDGAVARLVARAAYCLADAMLAKRKKEEKE